jgi:hypothetical protein
MRYHLVAKLALLLCPWKLHHVLFLLVWRVTMNNGRFVAGGYIFFFPSFFSPTRKSAQLSSLFLVFQFQFSFVWFFFNFCSYPFYKIFVCFQFSLSIIISHMLFFYFVSYSFDFQFFSMAFCLSFIGFQFHLSIKVYVVLFFSIWPLFFWFVFSFVKVIFYFKNKKLLIILY